MIGPGQRRVIYTDFTDEIGKGVEVAFGALAAPEAFEKFRAKVRHFLRQQQDHVAVAKLRTNRQLAQTDLDELERAKAQAAGLGLFVRSLVGLDRAAAKQAFAAFLAGRTLSGSQIEFADMVVDELTENSVMAAERPYERPYTGKLPTGVEDLFTPEAAGALFGVLEDVRRRAA